VVFGDVQRGVGPAKGGLVERCAQRFGRGRLDGRHPRPINRGVVAATRAEGGLVHVHDHRGAGVQRRAFVQQPRGELGQRAPAIGDVDAVFDRHRQLFVPLCADEGPPAPAAGRAHVAERVAVAQRRVSQVDQLGKLHIGPVQAAGAAQIPGYRLGIRWLVLARPRGIGQADAAPGLRKARQPQVHRVQVAKDDQVADEVKERGRGLSATHRSLLAMFPKYPWAYNNSAFRIAPPAAPRMVLWPRTMNL